jgi:hypothetical protein
MMTFELAIVQVGKVENALRLRGKRRHGVDA